MNVEFSNSDLKRKVRIPENIDEELAELMGAIVGDGHICYRPIFKKKHYEIQFVGHLVDDEEYIKRISFLFNKIFNVNVNSRISLENNASYLHVYSKAIVTYFMSIGMCHGNKTKQIQLVPNVIMKGNGKIKRSFLRGIADTDFCLRFKRRNDVKSYLHYEPCIDGGFSNELLAKDLVKMIKDLGIVAYSLNVKRNLNGKIFPVYRVVFSGMKNLQKWIELVGFNNYKHSAKYDIWSLYGFYPPKLTHEDREKILNGEDCILKDYLQFRRRSQVR